MPSVGPPPVVTFFDDFEGSALSDLWGRNWDPFGAGIWARSQTKVGNGTLTITAERRGGTWVSDLADTAKTFVQRYGVFSARVKVPAGTGFWSAFWLSQRPNARGAEAEIDIMEICSNPVGAHDGNDVTLLHNYVHRPDGSHALAAGYRTTDLSTDWHVYSLEWRRDRMSFYLDGVEVSRLSDRAEISDVPMAVALDLALGDFCGKPDESTPTGASMQVDWVRVTE